MLSHVVTVVIELLDPLADRWGGTLQPRLLGPRADGADRYRNRHPCQQRLESHVGFSRLQIPNPKFQIPNPKSTAAEAVR
jgi:hypothetical protein